MPKRRFCASSRLWYSGFSASARRRSAVAWAVNVSARSRRRSVASVRCPAARRASRRVIRSLLLSRSACSTAGQFFSWAGVSFSAALIAAMRASVNAAMSSAVSSARCNRSAVGGCWAEARCRPGDRQQGGAGNKCFPHRTLHRFKIRRRRQLRRANRPHKLRLGHAEQQSIRRSNHAQAPGAPRAGSQFTLLRSRVAFPRCGPGASRLDKIEEQARVDSAAAQGGRRMVTRRSRSPSRSRRSSRGYQRRNRRWSGST
jgi:hypothetical protein